MMSQNAHIIYIKMQNNERRCIEKILHLHDIYGEIIISKGCAKS